MTAENGLQVAQQFARSRHWYCLPLLPLTKLPGIADYYTRAALDDAALAGLWRQAERYARWLAAQHPDYADVKNKATVEAILKAREFNDSWSELPPGLGVNLAASGLVAVDVDTLTQERIWRRLCAEHGYDAGPRTVASPGVINKDGSVKHDGLGHYYYMLPDDLKDLNRANAAVNLAIGEPEDGASPDDRPALMAGRRYLVLPPTQRPEGFYVRTEKADVRTLPPFLAEILRAKYEQARLAKQRSESIAAKRTREDKLWRWHTQTPWSDVLPSDWSLTGHDGTCEVYAHPKSARSAVAHEPGCHHLGGDGDAVTPPPITFHTTTVPQYIEDALNASGGQSVSKLKLYAFKNYDGDGRAARRALGLPDRAPKRHAPTRQRSRTQPRHGQVLKVRRPLPDYSQVSTSITVAVPPVVIEPDDAVEQAVGVVVEQTEESTTEPTTVLADEPTAERIVEGFAEVSDAEMDALDGWSIDHPLNKLFTFVRERAVPADMDTLNSILSREVKAGEFCGLPNQPNSWSPWHIAARADRTALVEIEHFATAEVAEHLDVPTHRAQSWLRAMIPVMREGGVLLREREDDKDFNTYSDSATASANTRWAAWRLTEHSIESEED